VGLLRLPEELETIVFAHVLESCFNQNCYFLIIFGHFAYICVGVVKLDELRVFQRVLDSSVPEHLHHVEYVFGFVVFYRGFPMTQRVKVDLLQAWISHLCGYSFSLSQESSQQGP
jgi:hypothetical protein